MPLSARYASSPEGQPAAAKREAIPCDNHPDKVGTPAAGRQLRKSQKAQACPKAGQNRRLHRYVDLRQRGGPLHRSAPHTFLFRPCTAHFSFGKTERGPRRAPRGGERRSKGAGAVFAARRKRRQADFATTRAQHRQRCISAPLQARDLQLVPGLRQFCGQFFGSRQAGEGHKERLDFLAR